MSGALDPRIIWQRALVADVELPRTARLIGTLLGSQLSSAGLVDIAIRQLVEFTGYSEKTVRRALDALKSSGWLFVERRGFRGRASIYRADSPGLIHRSEVTVSGAEYRSWVAATSPEYRSPMTASEHENRSWVAATSPDYRSPMTASDPTSGHPRPAPFVRTEELRTYVGDQGTEPGRPSAAQAPALAVAEAPDVTAVIEALPDQLQPRSSSVRRRFATVIGQRLMAGWTVEQLVEAGAELSAVEARNPPGLWAANVPTAPPAAPAKRWRPTWCGVCEERTRMVELQDGTPMRCGNCHPAVHGVSEPAP